MLLSAIPSRFPIIFAASAPPGNVTYPFPVTAQSGGLASLPTGFVQANFTPVAAGGIPPWGKDANGILYQVTAWLQWMNAGGPVGYDASFSSSVGGYPNGAFIASATGPGLGWVSRVDSNTSNPDAGGANWSPAVLRSSSGRSTAATSAMYTFSGNPNGNVPGTAAVAGASPPDMCWDTTDNVLWVCTVTGNAAGAVWVSVNYLSSVTFPSHSVILGTGGTTFSSVGPSAANGMPFLSQGIGADPAFTPLDLGSSGVTGILPVTRGGTGDSFLPPNSVLLGNGTAAVTSVIPGGTGSVLTSNGLSSPPSFQPLPNPSTVTTGLQGSFAFGSNGTWTVPAGVVKVKARIWAGGAGGSGTVAGGTGCGSGGAGGGYIEGLLSVTPGNSMSVVVGGGGPGGGDGANGSNGGGSSFGGLSAGGGQGGLVGGAHSAGGGYAGGGSFGVPGFRGGKGGPGTSGGGGKGGGAFSTSDSYFDDNDVTNGIAGYVFGGGGTGAPCNGGSVGSGGPGAQGIVVLDW